MIIVLVILVIIFRRNERDAKNKNDVSTIQGKNKNNVSTSQGKNERSESDSTSNITDHCLIHQQNQSTKRKGKKIEESRRGLPAETKRGER